MLCLYYDKNKHVLRIHFKQNIKATFKRSLRVKKKRERQQNFPVIRIQPPSSSPFYNAVSRVKKQFVSSMQHETMALGEVVFVYQDLLETQEG